MALQALLLLLVPIVPLGTGVDTAGAQRVHVETSSTGQTLRLCPAEAPLTVFMAPSAAMGSNVSKISQRTVAHAGPASCGPSQTEVNAVEAVFGVRSITALVSTLTVTWPIVLFLLFLLILSYIQLICDLWIWDILLFEAGVMNIRVLRGTIKSQ